MSDTDPDQLREELEAWKARALALNRVVDECAVLDYEGLLEHPPDDGSHFSNLQAQLEDLYESGWQQEISDWDATDLTGDQGDT